MFLLVANIAIVNPLPCRANGSGVDRTPASAGGGVTPKQNSQVALISEDLHIQASAKFYSVSALYILRNPGPALEVLYGVPLNVTLDSPDAAIVAKGIQLRVGETQYRCGLEKDADANVSRSWCTVKIAIPAGERIPLLLEYNASYADRWVQGDGERGGPHPQYLEYMLFPAGSWKGPVRRVTITVDPGPLDFGGGEASTVCCYFDHQSGRKWSRLDHSDWLFWEGHDLDLAKVPDLIFEFDPQQGRTAHRVPDAAMIDGDVARPPGPRLPPEPRPTAARASSQLDPQHPAAAAIDGRRSTAWCAATKDLAPWIEVDIKDRGFPIAGIEIVPGNSLDQASWSDSRRPTRLRISACGAEPAADSPNLDIPTWPRPSLVTAPWPWGIRPWRQTCYRFSVAASTDGDGPVCIGDLWLLAPTPVMASANLVEAELPVDFYAPQKARDGSLKTAWAVPDTGGREWLRLSFEPALVTGVKVFPGCSTSPGIFAANKRVAKLKIQLSNGFSGSVDLIDAPRMQSIPLPHAAELGPASEALVTLEELLPGKKYEDVCLAEIAFETKAAK
jgi:hypothetical protein